MKTVIRFSKKEEAKALPILLRHFAGTILPDRTYILSDEAIRRLRQESIQFTEISREADAPQKEGAGFGERI